MYIFVQAGIRWELEMEWKTGMNMKIHMPMQPKSNVRGGRFNGNMIQITMTGRVMMISDDRTDADEEKQSFLRQR